MTNRHTCTVRTIKTVKESILLNSGSRAILSIGLLVAVINKWQWIISSHADLQVPGHYDYVSWGRALGRISRFVTAIVPATRHSLVSATRLISDSSRGSHTTHVISYIDFCHHGIIVITRFSNGHMSLLSLIWIKRQKILMRMLYKDAYGCRQYNIKSFRFLSFSLQSGRFDMMKPVPITLRRVTALTYRTSIQTRAAVIGTDDNAAEQQLLVPPRCLKSLASTCIAVIDCDAFAKQFHTVRWFCVTLKRRKQGR